MNLDRAVVELVVVDSVVDRLGGRSSLSLVVLVLDEGCRDLTLLLPWKDRLVGATVVVVLVDEVEVELLDGGFLPLLGEVAEDGFGLNLRRLPPMEGRLLVGLSVVVVVSSSVVVGGSVVVVVVVSSTSCDLASFRSVVLSKTLLTASSSSTSGEDIVVGVSDVNRGVGPSVVVVVETSETTKFGRTGNLGTSLLPYRKTLDTGFRGCGCLSALMKASLACEAADLA